jgi:hypothetical protein
VKISRFTLILGDNSRTSRKLKKRSSLVPQKECPPVLDDVARVRHAFAGRSDAIGLFI